MRVPDIQTDFGGGEVSPQTYGRVDLPIHKRACSILENAIPMPGGGVARIGGSVVKRSFGEVTTGMLDSKMKCALLYGGVGNPAYYLVGFTYNADKAKNTAWALGFDGDGWHETSTFLNFAGTGSTAFTAAINYKNLDLVVGEDEATGHSGVWMCLPQLVKAATTDGSQLICQAFLDPAKDDVSFGVTRLGIYQGRMLCASHAGMGLAGSKANDFSDFDISGASTEADAFEFNLKSEVSSCVSWLADQETLIVGCNRSEIHLGAAGGGAMTRTTAVAREYTRIGSSLSTKGEVIDDKIMFSAAGGGGLRAYEYLNDYQAYRSAFLSASASHISAAGISKISVQTLSDGHIVWCVLNNGNLAGFRYNSMTNEAGWFSVPKDSGSFYIDVAFGSYPANEDQPIDRLFVMVQRDGTTFLEEIMIEVDIEEPRPSSSSTGFVVEPLKKAFDLPYLRHCRENYYHDAQSLLENAPQYYRRNLVGVEQSGDYVKLTWDLPMVLPAAPASQKWRVYGNRKYQDYHDTDFIFEMSTLTSLSAVTTHAATVSEIDEYGDLGWLQLVVNFGVENSRLRASTLALGMLDSEEYYAVVDGEIFATNCKIDAAGVLVDTSTSTTTGLSVYGHNLYFGKYKYRSVIQTLPLEPGLAQGARSNRAVQAQLRFIDTVHAEVGANRNTTYPVDFTDPAAPSGEPPLPVNKRKTVTVRGNPSKDEDTFVTITSEYEGPMKVVGLSAYVDVGGS